jgi:hypothetical protein
MEDEWGYISVNELADLRFHGVPAIEIDRYFEPMRSNVALMEEPNFVGHTSLP